MSMYGSDEHEMNELWDMLHEMKNEYGKMEAVSKAINVVADFLIMLAEEAK